MKTRPSTAQPKRRAANLSVDADLLREAKELQIKLSQLFEAALREAVRQRKAERWRGENRVAIDSYNEHVARHGIFGDDLRSF
ncbi:MAG: type II toxin-antitoxin system CcdA family antitoxin [Deltaproteobacteria bacterium]|nr:type II toxin-antitoxin system CcdA family antitoxin [Deltaproteobacteria bacterium]